MGDLHRLRLERNKLWQEAKDFLEQHKGRSGLMRPSDTEEYDKMLYRISEINKEIKAMASEDKQKKYDTVSHPYHYTSGRFECIDVMLDVFGKEAVMDFCVLNAFKYLFRSKRKNGSEDIKKAGWYLNKFAELDGEKEE